MRPLCSEAPVAIKTPILGVAADELVQPCQVVLVVGVDQEADLVQETAIRLEVFLQIAVKHFNETRTSIWGRGVSRGSCETIISIGINSQKMSPTIFSFGRGRERRKVSIDAPVELSCQMIRQKSPSKMSIRQVATEEILLDAMLAVVNGRMSASTAAVGAGAC